MITNQTERLNFASTKNIPQYPDFLDVQVKSFQDFFQLETKSDERGNEGLYNTCLLYTSLGEVKGGDPVPLRLSEVNRMLGKVDELAVNVDTQSIPFKINETIKVIDGPFNGFNGTIEKINEEKRKLEVMVKIFGRRTPLELSFMQVEKV